MVEGTKEELKKVGGYISTQGNIPLTVYEEFKGETFDKETNFPKGLGAEHPFDFESVEKLTKKYGLVQATIAKIADSIVGDFEVKVDNPNSQAIIDTFIKSSNFKLNLRTWIQEALAKGNGFIEIDLEDQKLRVMNSNHMYVKRNKKGKVLEYNQWTKPLKQFQRDSPDVITFKPNQIAHLPINKVPNDPYGIGIIWPNERIIQNLIINEQDLQKGTSRKAIAPYHVKVGQPGANTPTDIVDAVDAKLQYLTNRTEWTTDADVEIKVVEFKDLGKNLTDVNMYWFRQFMAGVEVPEVLYGSGQLNEGIAQVQLEGWKRKMQSYRLLIASVAEEKIIRPLLQANNLDEEPEFVWELPTEEDINERILKITELLKIMTLGPMMRAQLEIELATLLGFEDLKDTLPSPEEAQAEFDKIQAENREREQEENKLKQPEVPGAKPRAREHSHLNNHLEIEESSEDMTLKDWVNIKEIAGFNYTDYLVKILQVLKNDPFADISAITESDIANGLLAEEDVKKLREVLKTGFRNNQTIRQIEDNINKSIDLKDRITDVSVISAASRANIIARSETVRLANEGLKNLYKENNITKVRWISALSTRTCPECEALNGRVFNINEISVGNGQPPLHPMCRCSLISVVE